MPEDSGFGVESRLQRFRIAGFASDKRAWDGFDIHRRGRDRDFVDEVPPENGDFLVSGILFSIFGHYEKLLWIG